MTSQEHINSIKYWLGEFWAENCSYKEFSHCMAESTPYLLAELDRQAAFIKALTNEPDAQKNLDKYLGGLVHGLLKALDEMGLEADFVHQHDDRLTSLMRAVDECRAATARARLTEAERGD